MKCPPLIQSTHFRRRNKRMTITSTRNKRMPRYIPRTGWPLTHMTASSLPRTRNPPFARFPRRLDPIPVHFHTLYMLHTIGPTWAAYGEAIRLNSQSCRGQSWPNRDAAIIQVGNQHRYSHIGGEPPLLLIIGCVNLIQLLTSSDIMRQLRESNNHDTITMSKHS